jgi:hypothetical protein
MMGCTGISPTTLMGGGGSSVGEVSTVEVVKERERRSMAFATSKSTPPESISLQLKGVVWRKKTSMTIKITYLPPEITMKIMCILAAYGTS